MNKSIFNILCIGAISLLLVACEDVIDLKVNNAQPLMIVEGWLSNKRSDQFVKLYLAKPINGAGSYTPVSGASVHLRSSAGLNALLTESSPGAYKLPATRVAEGVTYNLSIDSEYGSYEASTTVNRMSLTIDSLRFQYNEKSIAYSESGYYPYISGQEKLGKGDYMILKVYRNGKFLTRARDLNIIEDRFIDGNYLMNSELDIDSPFVENDRVKIEVWSLDEQAFDFWTDIRQQLLNGGVFATPLFNTRSNIKKTSPEAIAVNGFFGVSLVSSIERIIRPANAEVEVLGR